MNSRVKKTSNHQQEFIDQLQRYNNASLTENESPENEFTTLSLLTFLTTALDIQPTLPANIRDDLHQNLTSPSRLRGEVFVLCEINRLFTTHKDALTHLQILDNNAISHHAGLPFNNFLDALFHYFSHKIVPHALIEKEPGLVTTFLTKATELIKLQSTHQPSLWDEHSNYYAIHATRQMLLFTFTMMHLMVYEFQNNNAAIENCKKFIQASLERLQRPDYLTKISHKEEFFLDRFMILLCDHSDRISFSTLQFIMQEYKKMNANDFRPIITNRHNKLLEIFSLTEKIEHDDFSLAQLKEYIAARKQTQPSHALLKIALEKIKPYLKKKIFTLKVQIDMLTPSNREVWDRQIEKILSLTELYENTLLFRLTSAAQVMFLGLLADLKMVKPSVSATLEGKIVSALETAKKALIIYNDLADKQLDLRQLTLLIMNIIKKNQDSPIITVELVKKLEEVASVFLAMTIKHATFIRNEELIKQAKGLAELMQLTLPLLDEAAVASDVVPADTHQTAQIGDNLADEQPSRREEITPQQLKITAQLPLAGAEKPHPSLSAVLFPNSIHRLFPAANPLLLAEEKPVRLTRSAPDISSADLTDSWRMYRL